MLTWLEIVEGRLLRWVSPPVLLAIIVVSHLALKFFHILPIVCLTSDYDLFCRYAQVSIAQQADQSNCRKVQRLCVSICGGSWMLLTIEGHKQRWCE